MMSQWPHKESDPVWHPWLMNHHWSCLAIASANATKNNALPPSGSAVRFKAPTLRNNNKKMLYVKSSRPHKSHIKECLVCTARMWMMVLDFLHHADGHATTLCRYGNGWMMAINLLLANSLPVLKMPSCVLAKLEANSSFSLYSKSAVLRGVCHVSGRCRVCKRIQEVWWFTFWINVCNFK